MNRAKPLLFLLSFAPVTIFQVFAVTPVAAQGASIGLYTDVTGTTCSFSGNAPGYVNAYVVYRPDWHGVRGVQFAAPVPACMGAVFGGEVVAQGALAVGSSQTGISIALPFCYGEPITILTITYYRYGSTTPCCDYPIVPDPALGAIDATDCDFQSTPVGAITSHFNADASCACAGNSPPSAPSVPVPWDNSTGQSVRPHMSWSATDFDNNITEYDLYLGTSPTPPLVAAGLTQPNYQPAPLAELTQHYWRVVVRDALGLEASGPVWTFTTRVTNSPPNVPVNPDPADGAQAQSVSAVLAWVDWDIDEDPLVFDVYFGTSSPPPLVAAGVIPSNYAPGPLAFSSTYYWRIVARDPSDLETSGPIWSFTTRPENYPPNPPSNPSPANAAVGQLLDVSLAWAASDPDADRLVYDVYFGTSATPPIVATDVGAKTYSPGILEFSTWYYWRIVAIDGRGGETSGPTWIFSTRPENYPPNQPSSPTPPTGSGNRPLTQTLAWQCSDPDGQPITYDVYFGTGGAPPLVASNVPTKSYAPGLLAASTVYQWRVVARDVVGAETTSPFWSFTTKANSAPNAPSNPSPANNGVTSLSPVLAWTATDPDGQPLTYNVYLGTTSSPPLVATALTTPTYAPGVLQPAAQYFWRVLASDGQASTTSPTWKFTAAQPGDVDQNGQLTVDDASCALQIYFANPGCGGSGGAARADVDCSTAVTPRDARCIHKKVVNGSCTFCGSTTQAPSSAAFTAVVSNGAAWVNHDTLSVRLTVSGVSLLESFGFSVLSLPTLRLVEVARQGPSNGFAALEMRMVTPGAAIVGGYSLTGAPAGSTVEFIELRFLATYGVEGTLTILGFADDLAGASQVVLQLGTLVDVSPLETGLVLRQNHPNPFNPQTAIPYEIPGGANSTRVRLRILDIAGRVIRTLVDEDQGGGPHEAVWNGKDDRGVTVSSGIYFYVLDAGGERRTRKLVLLK